MDIVESEQQKELSTIDDKSHDKNKENDEREQDFIDKEKSPVDDKKEEEEEKLQKEDDGMETDKIKPVQEKPKTKSATKNRVTITPAVDSIYNVKNYYKRLFARNKKPTFPKRVKKTNTDNNNKTKVTKKRVTKKNKETLKLAQMGSEIRKIISKVKFEKTALEHFLFHIKNMSKTLFDEIIKTAKDEFKSKTITEPLILYYLDKTKNK